MAFDGSITARLPDSRRIAPIPRVELERRWGLVRDRLVERGIDALVALGGDSDLSGYTRWLTDTPVTYRKVVVFYADAPMTIVDHGAAGAVRHLAGNDPAFPGAGEIITVSAFGSVAYTYDHEARALVVALRRRGVRSVALVGPETMPSGFRRTLTEGLGEAVTLTDETAFIDRAKAIKSADEIALIEEAAALQDAAFAELVAGSRSGMRDVEIAALGQDAVRRRGGDAGIVLVGSAPPGEPGFMRPPLDGGRTTKTGDTITVLVENGSPAGYFCELGRNITVGAPSSLASELHAMLVEVQAETHKLVKPGAHPRDIFAAHNALMTRFGLPPEARLYAHGQGLDLIERPLVRDDEDMELAIGMCLAVHPAAVWRGQFGFVCDNVVIEADGPRRLHQTPRDLFRID